MVEAYRAAVEHDVAHDWAQSKAVIQALLHDDPASVDLWKRMAAVAVRAGSYDLALDAYDRVSAIQPVEADAHLGAATTLWRLRRPDEAVRRAERALSAAADSDLRLRGSAHELLARIAVGRRDAEAARAHARLAQEAEPDRPVLAFIEARLLQDQRRFEAALPLFDQAVAALGRSKGRAIADLHLFAAESLVRLERTAEAEYHFLEELRLFPLNGRARTELATLYNSTGRTDEAAQALADFVRLTPTPEAYSTAARLSQAFGHPDQAAEFRAEARRRSTAARQTAAR
jgi:tetratricopeptide (TPR) repeat protein